MKTTIFSTVDFGLNRKVITPIVESYEIFLRCAVQNCTPPIKEPVTRGKLRWRGVNVVHQGSKRWVEQRGVKISGVFEVEFISNPPIPWQK